MLVMFCSIKWLQIMLVSLLMNQLILVLTVQCVEVLATTQQPAINYTLNIYYFLSFVFLFVLWLLVLVVLLRNLLGFLPLALYIL
ncbi:hypothetical protein L873DRAFT_1805653 [Choiromyces venosus 120613-1]|uniref:Uncharacterized protein n=1 Tax=Choiromyces venosus 120613-1 TaxID=1336337 RepID=A0A3N4JPT6_9PEZI|nr:hypothetical protein L873DRAFT_1805653 [Choiromyces venosus 120613-1]